MFQKLFTASYNILEKNFTSSYVELQIKRSGRCAIPASEAECINGQYPDASYKYHFSGTFPQTPAGCYVYTSSTKRVYFNHGGTNCMSTIACLCKVAGKSSFA